MSAIRIEKAGCPLCGTEGVLRYKLRDLMCRLDGEYGQNYCRDCNLYFLSPRVAEEHIGDFYPRSYEPYIDGAPTHRIHTLAQQLTIPQKRRRMVERFVRGGRVLDVGCGNAAFLRALPDQAWRKYALDLEWSGAGQCPAEFHAGRFDHEKPAVPPVDAITMWHVFEHFYHPARALRHAAEMIKPGGFLFLAVPNHQSFDRWVFGRYWIGWDAPRHIATYSEKPVKTMLKHAGFTLRAVLPEATGVNWGMNFDFLMSAGGRQTWMRRSLALRALFSPVVFATNRLGYSSAKLYVAQR